MLKVSFFVALSIFLTITLFLSIYGMAYIGIIWLIRLSKNIKNKLME